MKARGGPSNWLRSAGDKIAFKIQGGPGDAEVRSAIKTFRAAGALCYLEGLETNEGFGISASFNPVRHQAKGSTLELAPKCVTLRFNPVEPVGWSWCHSTLAFGKEISHEVVVRLTDSVSRTRNDANSGKTTLQGKGKFSLPMFGEIGIDAGQELIGTSGTADTKGRTREVSTTERHEFAEFNHDRIGFSLHLSSPRGKDLVRLNPELNRLSVVTPPMDRPLNVQDVAVTMQMRANRRDDGVEHAYAIREATGSWAPLLRSPNKRIVTELLFSKFLQPIHKAHSLWPQQET